MAEQQAGWRSEKGQVLSLGSINADFQVRVERRPGISETLLAKDFARFGGGKAANVAFLARRLNMRARLFGCVGDDDLAVQALSPLREIGVDLSGVCRVEKISTGFAMISVPPDGKKGIVLAPNANESWPDDHVRAVLEEIRRAPDRSVLVLDCEIPVTVAEQAAVLARAHNLRVVLDPSPADRVHERLLRAVEVVTPNSGEAERLTGIECRDSDSAVRAGRRLLEQGVQSACVKLTDGGCVLVEKNRTSRITAVPVEVSDTTGAGDAFAGALAVALAEGRSPVDAARFAVAASHLAVTGYGSQQILPGREQLESMEGRLDVRTDAITSV